MSIQDPEYYRNHNSAITSIKRYLGNTNQSHKEIPPDIIISVYDLKRPTIISVGEDRNEVEPSHSSGDNAQCAAALEKSLALPQIVQHEVTLRPTNSLSGIYPRELKRNVYTKTCTWMLIATLFRKAKK